MINKLEVGKRLCVLRKKENYSQAELSEILQVSPQAVSKWETGISLPDIEILLKLSWLLKTSINSILEGDDYIEEVPNVNREHIFLNRILMCPRCRHALKFKINHNGNIVYRCDNNHEYAVVDGVLDFNTREIPGELWSLSLRNYDAYLQGQHSPHNSNYDRGLNQADVIWKVIESKRPRIILDMACGMGIGIKSQIERITWPVTIIMVDISHRILKWNKIFYSTEHKNPFVRMVYLACDGSNLPIMNNAVDLVFSYAGYESMQAKMMDGVREAYRVLKNGGCSVYTKLAIEDFKSENSKTWIRLLLSSLEEEEKDWWKKELIDAHQWIEECKKIGFTENSHTKIYGELPAPKTNKFPFKNEMAQWMAEYVFVSLKP